MWCLGACRLLCTATVLEDDLPGLMPFSVRMPDLS
jgi:hypothetical protein